MSYTTEQIKEHRLKWIEALESGEYQQYKYSITNHPDNPDAFCCIGVGCKVMDPNSFNPSYDGYTFMRDATGYDKFFEQECISWNDRENLTFPEIAAKLRERWNLPKIEEGVTQNEIHN